MLSDAAVTNEFGNLCGYIPRDLFFYFSKLAVGSAALHIDCFPYRLLSRWELKDPVRLHPVASSSGMWSFWVAVAGEDTVEGLRADS